MAYSFSDALTILKQGGHVRRQSWAADRKLGIPNPNGDPNSVFYRPVIVVTQTGGATLIMGWSTIATDIMANDWVLA